MDKVITCINCPVGCRMTVVLSDSGNFVSVSGNTCPRGAKYAEQECTHPLRVLTAVIPVSGSKTPLSVKTSVPVPKELIPDIMKKSRLSKSREIRQIRSSEDAGAYLLPYFMNEKDEVVYLLCLDSKRAVICCTDWPAASWKRHSRSAHARSSSPITTRTASRSRPERTTYSPVRSITRWRPSASG